MMRMASEVLVLSVRIVVNFVFRFVVALVYWAWHEVLLLLLLLLMSSIASNTRTILLLLLLLLLLQYLIVSM